MQSARAPAANLSPCLVGLEAGSGAHHIAGQIEVRGHDVRLIAAQYVKPNLGRHKNDYRDAAPRVCLAARAHLRQRRATVIVEAVNSSFSSTVHAL